MSRLFGWRIVVAALTFIFGVTPASAQLNTQHIKGTVGLKSGSQPPPHWYFIVPLIYTYNTDTVRNREGNQLPIDADITVWVYGGGINRVTERKLFGGN
jgi:hypothetical protein